MTSVQAARLVKDTPTERLGKVRTPLPYRRSAVTYTSVVRNTSGSFGNLALAQKID